MPTTETNQVSSGTKAVDHAAQLRRRDALDEGERLGTAALIAKSGVSGSQQTYRQGSCSKNQNHRRSGGVFFFVDTKLEGLIDQVHGVSQQASGLFRCRCADGLRSCLEPDRADWPRLRVGCQWSQFHLRETVGVLVEDHFPTSDLVEDLCTGLLESFLLRVGCVERDAGDAGIDEWWFQDSRLNRIEWQE